MYTIVSCHSNTGKPVSAYNNYTFDNKVIEKLPVYDSLAISILEKITLFQQSVTLNESYRAYRYLPTSKETDVFKELPQNAGSKIDYYYKKLGRDFIYGFDIFKDSSIKIYVRTYQSTTDPIDIEENLSYYPGENKMRKREYPDKDTALTKHWQYWTRFNKRSIF